MSFSGVAPTTSELNGNAAPGATYVGGSTTAPKTTTHKKEASQPVLSTKTGATTTTTTQPQAHVAVPVDPPYQYTPAQPDMSMVTDILPAFLFVALITAALVALVIRSARRNPVHGYAHKHKVHHPGKMNPHAFKH